MKTIKIGSGSGFSEDWVEPAENLAKSGQLDYLVFEALAERTIHDYQILKKRNPNKGYGCRFEQRMQRCLLPCLQNGTKIITNDGAANPKAAALWLKEYCQEQGIAACIAVVEGDEVTEYFHQHKQEINYPFENRFPANIKQIKQNMICANVYIGHEPILQALELGADVVITGRVADPSLFVAPILFEFDWDSNDWDHIAFATLVGHLLECSGHVTGGYYTDLAKKNANDLVHIGFPIAEVSNDATVVITKLLDSGGVVNRLTVLEQLHYEIHDLNAYITPDVIADFSTVKIVDIGCNRVRLSGARGNPKPKYLKALLSYHEGYKSSASIRYRGFQALERAKLAQEIIEEKLKKLNPNIIRCVYLFNDLPYEAILREEPKASYVEFRISAVTNTKSSANELGLDFMGLYLNGPFGGGGIERDVTENIPIVPLLLPREAINTSIDIMEVL